MTMTKKHFEQIADAFAFAYHATEVEYAQAVTSDLSTSESDCKAARTCMDKHALRRALARKLADGFETDNPRFDRDRFLKAAMAH